MHSRGEIWFFNLDPTIGAEIKKTRPVVIISSNSIGKLPLRTIVPITEWKAHYASAPWMVELTDKPLHGLVKHSGVDCFQIRSVSTDRFVHKLGEVTDEELKTIVRTVGLVIEIPSE
jgi:mRNA interferase MazF